MSARKSEESPERREISLDELFELQGTSQNLATIQRVEDDSNSVKVTPWTENGGCRCQCGMVVPADTIASVKRTDHVYMCCGKRLHVVELQWKSNAKLSLEDVFHQMSERSASQAQSGGFAPSPFLGVGNITGVNPQASLKSDRCKLNPWLPECLGVQFPHNHIPTTPCRPDPVPEVQCSGIGSWAWEIYKDTCGNWVKAIWKRNRECIPPDGLHHPGFKWHP